MATSYTPRLTLPEMADGEGSGYVTFNELARILDALLLPGVQSRSLTTPPGSPADGQCWYVPPGATGAWAGQERKLAQWYNGVWYFYTLPEVFEMWDTTNTQRIHIDGADVVHVSDDPADGGIYSKRNGEWIQTSASLAAAVGAPASGAVGTSALILTNWSEAHGLGFLVGAMNATTGVFTAPAAGLYSMNVHVNGQQGNTIKEESLFLEATYSGGTDDGTEVLAHESVDTDKTPFRTLSANYLRSMAVNEQMNTSLRATASLGTFTFANSTFEVSLINPD